MRHLYWIASLVCALLIGMILRVSTKEVRRNHRSHRFLNVLVIAILLISVDTVWVMSEIDLLVLPHVADGILAAMYYSLTGFAAYASFLYSEEMQHEDATRSYSHAYGYWMVIPAALLALMSVLSIFWGWIFTIGPDGVHQRGVLHFVQPVIASGYLLLTGSKALFRAGKQRNPYLRNRFLTIGTYSVTVMLMTAFQVIIGTVPFLNIGMVFGVLQAYFFIFTFEREQLTNYSKIKSFSKLFLSAYYVDLHARTLERIDVADHIKNSTDFDEHRESHMRPYDRAMDGYISRFVHPQDADEFRRRTSLYYIEEHLDGKHPYYHLTYRQVMGKTVKWYRMYVILSTLLEKDAVANALICFMDVDTEQRLMARSDYYRNVFISAATDAYAKILQINVARDRVYDISFREGEVVKKDTGRNVREHLENFSEAILPEFREEVISRCRSIIDNPMINEVSYGYKGGTRIPGDDSLRWFVTTIRAIHYEGERLLMVFVADNTEKIEMLEALEEKRRADEMNGLIINVLSSAVESRSTETGDHINRMASITSRMLEELRRKDPRCGVDAEAAQLITRASAMHDVGKIAISDSILLKPSRLTAEEFEEMKRHTLYGCDILSRFEDKQSPFYRYCYDICRWHHERYDGAGYPDGLVGEEIPLWAQVVSIVDVYDALVNKRAYKPAYSHEEAMRMIDAGECGVFSPRILESFHVAMEHDKRL